MHPAELFEPFGNIDPRQGATTEGIVWLRRLAEHFERSVWINPDDKPYWDAHRPHHPAHLPDVPPQRRRHRPGDAGAGRRQGAALRRRGQRTSPGVVGDDERPARISWSG